MKFPEGITSKLARPMLKARKVAPQVMFVGGVLGVVGAGVLACRATLKIDETLEKATDRQLQIQQLTHNEAPGFEAEKYEKHMAQAKLKFILDMGKLYAPAVGLAVLSIGLLTGSHVTLTRRNAATAAAYAALNDAYGRYRGRVIDKYGTEEDDRLRHGVTYVDETITTDSGKTKTVQRERCAGMSEYARLFTEGNKNWQPNPTTNWFFLNAQERYWNDRLQSHGHVFLNEIYDALGLDRTPAGQVVGWVVGENGRDGYISFGLTDSEGNERIRDFMDGGEGSAWLDFNVDGVVFEMI